MSVDALLQRALDVFLLKVKKTMLPQQLIYNLKQGYKRNA